MKAALLWCRESFSGNDLPHGKRVTRKRLPTPFARFHQEICGRVLSNELRSRPPVGFEPPSSLVLPRRKCMTIIILLPTLKIAGKQCLSFLFCGKCSRCDNPLIFSNSALVRGVSAARSRLRTCAVTCAVVCAVTCGVFGRSGPIGARNVTTTEPQRSSNVGGSMPHRWHSSMTRLVPRPQASMAPVRWNVSAINWLRSTDGCGPVSAKIRPSGIDVSFAALRLGVSLFQSRS